MPPLEDGESITKPGEGETHIQAEEQDDALWNEVASERKDPPADDAAGLPRDPAEQGEVDAKSGSDAVKLEDSDENNRTAGANSDPPVLEASNNDIWANAPPELKAAFLAEKSALETKLNSVKGRLSVQDRLLDEFRNGSPGAGQRVEGGHKPAGKAKDLLESPEFKAFREEYGTNLQPMISAIEAMAERQDAVEGSVQSVKDQRQVAFYERQLEAYAGDHPDWANYGNDERFGPWLEKQPGYVREAAARNREYIVDAAEASDLLTRFKAAHGIGISPTPTPTPAPAESDSRGDERRDRQREGGRASGVRGGPASTAADPDDPDALWDAVNRKREQQRR